MRVAATDANDLTGPGVTRGAERTFRIVTNEELLDRLFNREVDLRQTFERSIAEVEAVAVELNAAADEPPEEPTRVANRAAGELSQNAGQTRAVAAGFRSILRELVNNRVQTSQQVARIEGLILEPLDEIADRGFPAAERSVGGLRDGDAPAAADFAAAAGRADRLAADMRVVLREMEDLAEFNEAVRDLKQLVERQEGLRDRTRDEQERDLLDVFDLDL